MRQLIKPRLSTQIRQLLSGKTGYEVGVSSTTPCLPKKQRGSRFAQGTDTRAALRKESKCFVPPSCSLPHRVGAKTLRDRAAGFHFN